MFLAEKKLLPLFFIRNLDIQVSVWSHLKVPWDITAGLGASKSSKPSSQGTGPGIGGGGINHHHAHKHRGTGSSNWSRRYPGGARWTPTSTPSPSDQTNPSRAGSHLQPEGHRTALSPCISYRWSLRNCLAVLWASGWQREQGQIQANTPVYLVLFGCAERAEARHSLLGKIIIHN